MQGLLKTPRNKVAMKACTNCFERSGGCEHEWVEIPDACVCNLKKYYSVEDVTAICKRKRGGLTDDEECLDCYHEVNCHELDEKEILNG